jgi:DNA-binding transcriptional LysR family regulator
MFDWNDLRYFIAVAETGSTLAAGRALRVSQTTVARRVAALEQALGVTLFERRQAGYVATPVGEELLVKARTVEAAANIVADAAAGQAREVSGTVRLTTEEIFAVTILSPILRELHDANPGIRIELDTSEQVRDLSGGAAEVALRSSAAPTGGGLIGRRVADDIWAFYCSRDYAAQHGIPAHRGELRNHPIVAGGGTKVWQVYGAWLRENGLEDAVALHHGTATGLLAAVRSGVGLAVLPCIVADLEPDLVRCLPPTPGTTRGLWLLTHERVRHTPRVRVVLDLLADRLAQLARTARARRSAADALAG